MTISTQREPATPLQPARVLIVTDNNTMASELATVLSNAGHTAAYAASPEYALDACTSQSYQLAIIDESVCQMAGPELARALRDLFDVPTLFLSAYEDLEIVSATLEDGSLGFIVKPLEPTGLLPALQIALARAQAMRPQLRPNTLRDQVDNYWRQLVTMGNKLFAATDQQREIDAAILRSRRTRNVKH
jgi:DNA-binding response OmpR family regulator